MKRFYIAEEIHLIETLYADSLADNVSYKALHISLKKIKNPRRLRLFTEIIDGVGNSLLFLDS